ncbi:MAG TPA: M20/M25/M40 family metallo-hydrolase [Anaerolineales bacterium]|nr:M20/M25/M40 family metallo-hydrolase [Anaerolineales bacterium]
MDPLLLDRIIDLAIQIQQIPSPTFGEMHRAEFIRDQFLNIGAMDVSTDEYGDVYVHLIGRGEKPPLIISAHLDTVFPAGTSLTCTRTGERIYGPGIGDNSLGLAGLFGLYWSYNQKNNQQVHHSKLAGDLWLIANVGEEGLGDLKGMKAVVDRFGSTPLAYLVLEGMSLGQIYVRGLGVRRYRIQVHTKGGHSWVDYGNPSAIHEIADLIMKIKSMSVPIEPRSSINVGMIHGGTSVNTIAAEASLELDLRSESPETLNTMIEQVLGLVDVANQSYQQSVQVCSEVIGDRPAGQIPIDHPIVKASIECFARKGINVQLNIGSTDANVPLSRGYPAICMGLTVGAGSHTLGEYIEIKPVSQGFSILTDLVQSLFNF